MTYGARYGTRPTTVVPIARGARLRVATIDDVTMMIAIAIEVVEVTTTIETTTIVVYLAVPRNETAMTDARIKKATIS
jgi:hypothetical protein